MNEKKLDPVSVIVNVYNEAETIEDEIRTIYETIVSRIPGSEFIVAEECSIDGTGEIVIRLKNELGLIHSTGTVRKGYMRALRDAFMLAKCPFIFFSDTGNKHDQSEFWELYKYRHDYGLVVGVKTGRSDQLYRRFLTFSYNKILSWYFNVDLHDADSGFRLYQKKVVDTVFNEPWVNKELISSEIMLRVVAHGFPVKEVPVSYRQRKGHSRGLPLKKIPKVILHVLKNMPRLKRELFPKR
ncbi:MAG: glycosyltransferase family 2 protein [Candidatus Auribacterota bacterium]|jgi:glycosyltransferase involved in cell wall biosynthesis|nr:glycosyltransferase family 2 protein [Candidatus Auribacterota bacterium]